MRVLFQDLGERELHGYHASAAAGSGPGGESAAYSEPEPANIAAAERYDDWEPTSEPQLDWAQALLADSAAAVTELAAASAASAVAAFEVPGLGTAVLWTSYAVAYIACSYVLKLPVGGSHLSLESVYAGL